jgi:cysteine desulfurase/selenocysteine lyase
MNVESIRRDFPILQRTVNGKPLVYLDSGATAQKPERVIEAVNRLHREQNANIHRGVHQLSAEATQLYEQARERVRRFIGAAEREEVVFTSGATASINTVAYGWGLGNICEGDNVVVSEMEHHSNLVPWQQIAQRNGAELRVLPFDDEGRLMTELLPEILDERTKLVAVTQVSNVLGTINPVAEIIRLAHAQQIPVLVDGAQGAAHLSVDVQALDADFYAFSAHKLYGPTGLGVLYGKRALLDAMPPYQGGGEMIDQVYYSHSTYNQLPYKFEAGTPDFIGTTAFTAALRYVQNIGMDKIARYEDELLQYATEKMQAIEGLHIIGQAEHKSAVISFVIDGIHPYDLGLLLDKLGIAIRTGHHCAQPLLESLGYEVCARASFSFYNTFDEIDTLVAALLRIQKMFK